MVEYIERGESALVTRQKLNDLVDRSNWFTGSTYPSRAEAQGATVPAPVTRIAVTDDAGFTLHYVADTTGSALTTADGRTWAPDGDVYLEHYGATGDGATFDGPAIKAALEAGHPVVHSRGGRTYLIAESCVCTVAGPLTFRHDGWIKGDGSDAGWASDLVLSIRTTQTDRHRIVVDGSGVIDASQRTNDPGEGSGTGLAIRYSDDVIVRGIEFFGGTRGDGKGDSGFVPEYCHRVLVDGCTFFGWDDHDIYATGAADPVTDATRGEILTVTGCFFSENGAGSIRIARDYRQIIVTGNHAKSVGKLVVTAGGASNLKSASIYTITDNIVFGSRNVPIDLRYSAAAAGSIVANNQIYDWTWETAGPAIGLRGTSQVIVTGNVIKAFAIAQVDSVGGAVGIYVTAATGDDSVSYQSANVQIFGNTIEVFDRSGDTVPPEFNAGIVDLTNAAFIFDNVLLNAYPRDIRVGTSAADDKSTYSPRVRRMGANGAGFGGAIPAAPLQVNGAARVARTPRVSDTVTTNSRAETQYIDISTDAVALIKSASPTDNAKKLTLDATTNETDDAPSGGALGVAMRIRGITGLELQSDRSTLLVSHSAEPAVAADYSIAMSDGTASTNGFGTLGKGLYEKLSGAWYKIGQTLSTYTVATLPSAFTAGQGARAIVTDSTVNTFHSTLTGGGIHTVPVFSTGGVWRIG